MYSRGFTGQELHNMAHLDLIMMICWESVQLDCKKSMKSF